MAKNEKICIIGGGPAGLSAAVHLEKNGYTDYAILEKEDHVGGKCHSPYHDGKRFETVRNLNALTADKTASPTIRSIPKRIRSLSRTFFA